MKQVFIRNGKIIVDEVPSPTVGDNEVLVANAYSAISIGTEAMAIKGNSRNITVRVLRQPSLIRRATSKILQEGIIRTLQRVRETTDVLHPLGYSTAGTVLAVGRNVTDINPGERVACGGGQFAHHAEVVSVARNLVAKVPSNVTFEQASFATIGAIAMHGIRRAGIQFGGTIVILGLGLLGLLAVQIGKKAGGYKIIGFDIDKKRVKVAKKLGIDSAFSLNGCDPVKETLALTCGFGADAVVIYAATQSSEAVNLAFDLCRPKAKVVAVGAFGMDLNRDKMYQKELELVMSTAYGPGRYDPVYEEQSIDYPIGYVRWTENRNMEEFLDMIAKRKIDAIPLISAVYPIEEAPKAYELLQQSRVKPAILLKYDFEKYSGAQKIINRIFINDALPAITSGRIKTAIIGAGSFIQNYRLPILKKLSNYYHLRAIVTAHGENCKYLAEKYRADYASTDCHEVIEDPDVDLIIIGTRHNLHYPIIVDALKAGKKVFTEKPLCLQTEELKSIIETVNETGIPVIVGFNKRYSPLSIALKKTLEMLPKPYFIQYRVNVGFIPKNHWTQNPDVGGGRIVSEGCHFFDFFKFLVGTEEILQIKVEPIPLISSHVVARDNVAVIIKYSDGSLANLSYTTLGSTEMEKERVEVFAGGKSFIIHDYRWLQSYGFPLKGLNLKAGKIRGNKLILPAQDKGWEQELIELGKFLTGKESQIIPFSEAVKAMQITFEVERLIGAQSG